jgi:ATP-binding cassette subfamily B protein
VRSFTQPISQIANISNILQQTAAAAERVFEFLSENEEAPEDQNALCVNMNGAIPNRENQAHVSGNVAFEHVAFGYNPEQVIISDFSAR